MLMMLWDVHRVINCIERSENRWMKMNELSAHTLNHLILANVTLSDIVH